MKAYTLSPVTLEKKPHIFASRSSASQKPLFITIKRVPGGGEVCHVRYYVAPERGTEGMRAMERPCCLGGGNNLLPKLRRPQKSHLLCVPSRKVVFRPSRTKFHNFSLPSFSVMRMKYSLSFYIYIFFASTKNFLFVQCLRVYHWEGPAAWVTSDADSMVTWQSSALDWLNWKRRSWGRS